MDCRGPRHRRTVCAARCRARCRIGRERRRQLAPDQRSPTHGKLLHLLGRLQGARKILEIGALGGYSTIWMGRALPPGGKLISLEFDPNHAEIARANIARLDATKPAGPACAPRGLVSGAEKSPAETRLSSGLKQSNRTTKALLSTPSFHLFCDAAPSLCLADRGRRIPRGREIRLP